MYGILSQSMRGCPYTDQRLRVLKWADKQLSRFMWLAMVAVIVGADLIFFRNRVSFWERLMVNVGIVCVFVAFYLRFLRGP